MANNTAAFWSRASKHLMPTGVPYLDIIVTRAKGNYIYDENDRGYLDFTSGQMATLLGHSHPEISEVVTKYATELDHLNSQALSPPVVDLAEDLAAILPAPLEKSFFLSTGSESVEAAIGMAKCYTGKFEIVAFTSSYHGITSGASSATYSMSRKHGNPPMPGQFAFPAPHAYRSPFRHADGSYDWQTEMAFGWAMVDAQSVGSLAAFIFEPILSAGGIIEPPVGYMKVLAAECRKRGMLLIADEAQTGLGRCGDVFAFQRDEIVPDILALSKTIGAGLPLASVSTTAAIAQRALERKFVFITTHYNDPLPCAVGSKVIELLLRDGQAMVQNARVRGAQLREGMLALQRKYWFIGDARGRGLLQGMEIVKDPVTKAEGAEWGMAISQKVQELGMSVQVVAHGGCGVFRLAPPLTITKEEIEEALDIMDRACQFVVDTMMDKSVSAAGQDPVGQAVVDGPRL
jgi:4-aminobutyrate aminotransferase-like enzyme